MVKRTKTMEALLAGATAASMILAGCNSAVTALTGGTAVTGNTTATSALMTDAPGDQVVALGLTVNGIRMYDASGKYADVLTSPVTIEASHLDGVDEPLKAALSIPQDTYTSAVITVSSPTVSYVDPATKKVVQATTVLASATDTVTFSTPITVTATSTPLCFDLMVGQSVALSGTMATVTPVFDVRAIPLASNPTNGGNGKLDDIHGAVVSVSGTTLILATPNATQVTITTNASTVLQGFSSLSALTVGSLVDVDLVQQTSGTLLAARIHRVPGIAANELVGLVTATTGSPVTSFTQTVRQWIGPGTAGTIAGTSYTIAVASGTTFATSANFGTLPSLPFTPVFTAGTLFAGQNVEVDASAVSGTSATAGTVTLVPQTIDGTVAAISSQGGFTAYTVTLNAGSSLATLTGATSVVVFTTASTQMMNSASIVVGGAVRFNGLLFLDAGVLKLVCGGAMDGPGAPPPQKHG
ncbi:hypothetical protein SAMN05421771_0615 [Granulicella pectinivorans]|uniref:DUF5666 domain-containing protein n=1 Tax=Granulicella pectinivorans TaxID=474950 RepID=A0A1I6LE82_9BACT|nr:DUF5666 domain-containing protein [Granulicella pectinivorans]SFS01781.1 hypothetical protein SAMN05421771_0615 [Granulicella pectinivorans]